MGKSADIIIKEPEDTVEICSQGGINAAKGFSDFKVYPVQVISRATKTRRENSGSGQRQHAPSEDVAFSVVLDRVMVENQPTDCYTVTYNANRELQTYFYQPSREYTL